MFTLILLTVTIMLSVDLYAGKLIYFFITAEYIFCQLIAVQVGME